MSSSSSGGQGGSSGTSGASGGKKEDDCRNTIPDSCADKEPGYYCSELYNLVAYECRAFGDAGSVRGNAAYCPEKQDDMGEGEVKACTCSVSDAGPRDDAGLHKVCDDASTDSPCGNDDSKCPDDPSGNPRICFKQEGPSRCELGCRRDSNCRGSDQVCQDAQCISAANATRED